MKEQDRKWLSWIIIVALTVVSTLVGVNFPIPPPPAGDEITALGISHFTGLDVSIPTTVATATPGAVIDNSGLSVILELRDAATPVASWYNGGVISFHGNQFDLDADSDTSITVSTDDQVDIEIAGSDVYSITAAAISLSTDRLDLDADLDTSIDASTDDQVDIEIGGADVYSITAAAISLSTDKLDLDADLDTSIDASTDDQVDFEVGGSDVISFTASYATFSVPVAQWFKDETITAGEWLTPTANIYALDSGGAVTMTLGTASTIPNGFILILIGDDNNAIAIADTNIRTNDGGAAALGQYDVVMFVYQDSEWHQVVETANS
jgi:hypothetical protein